jgi:hypothetical protein
MPARDGPTAVFETEAADRSAYAPSEPPRDGRGAMPDRRRLARVILVAGILALVGAEAGLAAGFDWVGIWFYDLAWFSYIAIADAIVHLRTGRSMLLSRPASFFLLLPWSAAFWLFFEVANFALRNWYYVEIAPGWWTQGPGMALSFSTVFPAIFETADLLGAFGVGGRAPAADRARASAAARAPASSAASRRASAAATGRVPLEAISAPTGPSLTSRAFRGAVVAGFVSLAIAVLVPRYGFPLVWIATFLLVDPLVARRGGRSILTTLAVGERGPTVRLLAAGLVAGGLWEFWNFWARSKWIYTVPFFEDGKIFEMPVLGFLGFPPFALECYAFARLLVSYGLVPEWEAAVDAGVSAARPFAEPAGSWEPSRPSFARRRVVGIAVAAAFAFPAIAGVNRFTVRSWIPSIDDVTGLPDDLVERLRNEGIREPRDLVRAFDAGTPPSALAGVESAIVDRWVAEARLMGVRGLAARGARWLASVGVDDVADLAAADPENLVAVLERDGDGPAPAPIPAEVRIWVEGARLSGARSSK